MDKDVNNNDDNSNNHIYKSDYQGKRTVELIILTVIAIMVMISD